MTGSFENYCFFRTKIFKRITEFNRNSYYIFFHCVVCLTLDIQFKMFYSVYHSSRLENRTRDFKNRYRMMIVNLKHNYGKEIQQSTHSIIL